MQEKRPRSTTISSTTVSSMPPGAPGALPVLPLGMCWQLQDGPDYHLSWGRGQGRLRRCGGVLWAFKRRKCVEIAKRALLAHLGLEHAGPPGARALTTPTTALYVDQPCTRSVTTSVWSSTAKARVTPVCTAARVLSVVTLRSWVNRKRITYFRRHITLFLCALPCTTSNAPGSIVTDSTP
jgi:hypothetical protein